MPSTHRAAVAAMLLTTLLFAATMSTDAAAQSRAALVQDVDEPGRSPYQEGTRATCFATCTLTFSAVPAGMRLVITHVNGTMDTIGTGVSPRISFGGGSFFATLPSVRGIVIQSDSQMIFDQAIVAYYGPGEQPIITGDFTLGLFRSLTDRFGGPSAAVLTGYYVRLP